LRLGIDQPLGLLPNGGEYRVDLCGHPSRPFVERSNILAKMVQIAASIVHGSIDRAETPSQRDSHESEAPDEHGHHQADRPCEDGLRLADPSKLAL
jgi:hypothetical protein